MGSKVIISGVYIYEEAIYIQHVNLRKTKRTNHKRQNPSMRRRHHSNSKTAS